MNKILLFLLLTLVCFNAFSSELIFKGTPTKKIEITEASSATFNLTSTQSYEFTVVIEKEGDKYYWRSRNNTELIPIQYGAYVTYMAINGSGYIRIYTDVMQEMYHKLSETEKANSYLYMEHLVHQLGSITYFGK